MALVRSVHAPLLPGVRCALGCSGWPWQNFPGKQGGVGTGCSGLHNQSSPVAQTGTCSGLLQVALIAGPRVVGGAGARCSRLG